jgi:hypothetical protein
MGCSFAIHLNGTQGAAERDSYTLTQRTGIIAYLRVVLKVLRTSFALLKT